MTIPCVWCLLCFGYGWLFLNLCVRGFWRHILFCPHSYGICNGSLQRGRSAKIDKWSEFPGETKMRDNAKASVMIWAEGCPLDGEKHWHHRKILTPWVVSCFMAPLWTNEFEEDKMSTTRKELREFRWTI